MEENFKDLLDEKVRNKDMLNKINPRMSLEANILKMKLKYF